jgi:small nuclear ribonucleoprotein (snRNP)-like protein
MTTTQMKTPLNPRPYINELVGKKILVRLKWGMTYTGKSDYMRKHQCFWIF